MATTSACHGLLDADNIVQEWAIAGQQVGLDYWRQLSPQAQEKFVQEQVELNGITRPQGYTVSFHYNPRVEAHHFGKSHPMKPWRLTLTKQLILSYGLQYAMNLHESRLASKRELSAFHTVEYLDFLEKLDPRLPVDEEQRTRFLGSAETNADCPLFDGMWDYFRFYSGASIEAARALANQKSDIAINWSGGLHHAHKNAGAGFCYINDIVIAIQELLVVYPRVLYVDIDVHHGDGVEEAFFSTDRVLTLSFHKYGDGFFPGTGNTDDTGPRDAGNPGAHHSLNVPLKDGITDAQWQWLFENITGPVIAAYNPAAIVLQCGADSLGGDRLGSFNINIKAHGYCVEFVKSRSHGVPLLVIGGGGYTPRNVARCWTHETALCVGAELGEEIPAFVPYRQAFQGEEHGAGLLYPRLDNIPGKIHANSNASEYLQGLVENVLSEVRYLQGAPSVQMQYIPSDCLRVREEEDARIREEEEERERYDQERRRKEKNLGVRGEKAA